MENTTTPTATGNQPTTKKCTKCGRELPLTEFHKRSASEDGLQSWCKHCIKIANANNYKVKVTPPQSVTAETHPIFSKMQPREVQAEIRERIDYLRATGWECEVKLRYVQVKEITL